MGYITVLLAFHRSTVRVEDKIILVKIHETTFVCGGSVILETWSSPVSQWLVFPNDLLPNLRF